MSRRRGFTLIEVLLVIVILAAVAGSAVALLEAAGGDGQVRREDTRLRLERLREAILGPEGAPTPRGFVADVGRLPLDLRELLAPPTPPPGWRGPYLRALPGPSGALELPDGWGNAVSATSGPDAASFGWHVVRGDDGTAPVASGELLVQSLGRDGAPGASPPGDPLAADDPPATAPLVRRDDWLVPLAGRRLACTLTLPAPATLDDVRLTFPDGLGGVLVATATPTTPGPVTLAAGDAELEVEFSAAAAAPQAAPLGRHRLTATAGALRLAADVDLLPRAPLPRVRLRVVP